jgi:hypothetical protein
VTGAALALLIAAGPVHADDSIVRTQGTDCGENAVPIAGSSGFENARHAFRTTGQTYSATAYAERNLFKHSADDDATGDISYDFFQMVKAATVPSHEPRAGGEELCPASYGVSLRPVDVQAVAMGASFHKGAWGGFYAASVAYGNTAMPNNFVRGQILFAQPIYAATTLAVAPLARNGLRTQEGASSFALDWVAGATYTHPFFGVRAGYAGSRGFYANVVDNKLGMFVSGLLGGQDRAGGLLSYVRMGFDRLVANKLVKGMGLTTLFYRDLPYGLQPSPAAPAAAVDEGGRLRTVHFAQQNLARYVDVEAAYGLRPTSFLQHAILGVHAPDYVTGRKGKGPEAGFVWNLRGGLVNVPAQAMFGLEGGRYLSAKAELGAKLDVGTREGARIVGALLINDPELLALYPYAVDATTFRLHFDGAF